MAESFQRARTGAQRQERRESILASATQMLEEMPVALASFSELSKRVGLARSNLMRYFESREAVLLEILDQRSGGFLDRAELALREGVKATWPLNRRVATCARLLSEAFTSDPVLCDLLSQQAAVLEHNVSRDTALHYKRAVLAHIGSLAALLSSHLPELRESDASEAAALIVTLTGALWTHTHPAPAMLEAFAADPTVDVIRSFPAELEAALLVTLRGSLPRD